MRVIRQASIVITKAAPGAQESLLLELEKKDGKTPQITEIRTAMSSVGVVGSDETHAELPASSLVGKGHIYVSSSSGRAIDSRFSDGTDDQFGLTLLGEMKGSKDEPIFAGNKDGRLFLHFVKKDLDKGQVPPAAPGYLLLTVEVVAHYL